MVELEADKIYRDARDSNVGFLVVGDPLCATTHVDLILRAKKEGVIVEVIHNTSVMGAVASCGLQLYQYGYTVSIPFFEENWRPFSFYDRIKYNQDGGMHTLCLLDIKVREPDYDTMQKFGKVKLMPPRFMTVSKAKFVIHQKCGVLFGNSCVSVFKYAIDKYCNQTAAGS